MNYDLNGDHYKHEIEIYSFNSCSHSDIVGMKLCPEKSSHDSMSHFIALRFDHLRFDDASFDASLADLAHTKYSLKAMSADAPGITHCITAVRYIIAKSTGFTLPYTYIGDLLSDMMMTGFAGARLVPLHEHERGNLVFFHRKSPVHRAYMITHVGIFVDDAGNYFHSSNDGGIVDNISHSLIKGTIVSCELAMRRTDPRMPSQNRK